MVTKTAESIHVKYLEIGLELVGESLVESVPNAGLALAHVKLADVANRAGVTKGALYHLWKSQEDFWDDLLDYLVSTHALFGMTELTGVLDGLTGEDSAELSLREFVNVLFDTLSVSSVFLTRISLFSYLGNEEVHASFVAEFAGTLAFIEPILESTLAQSGRALIEPHTFTELTVALAALLEGLCLQHQIAPERTADIVSTEQAAASGSQRISLYAAAAESLIYGYTKSTSGRKAPEEPRLKTAVVLGKAEHRRSKNAN